MIRGKKNIFKKDNEEDEVPEISYQDWRRQQQEQEQPMSYQEAQAMHSEHPIDAQNIEPRDKMTLKDLRDVADNPSPKGKYPIRINGKIFDLNYLENYVLEVNSFKMLSKLKRYNSGLIYDRIGGYENTLMRAKRHRRKK